MILGATRWLTWTCGGVSREVIPQALPSVPCTGPTHLRWGPGTDAITACGSEPTVSERLCGSSSGAVSWRWPCLGKQMFSRLWQSRTSSTWISDQEPARHTTDLTCKATFRATRIATGCFRKRLLRWPRLLWGVHGWLVFRHAMLLSS